jgi:hypothetical protein
MKAIAGILVALGGALATAQPGAAPPSPELATVESAARQLIRVLGAKTELDAANVRVINLPQVYERNGWTTEPDRFSLELAQELDALPPWEFERHIELVTRRLSDRYLLDEQQEQTLRGLVEREWGELLARHVGRLVPVITEVLQTRLAGEPYAPEQVARWTELTEPVFEDGRRRLLAAADEFMNVLTPQQRELVQTDLDAAARRIGRMQELRESWRRGAWNPADWGLDRDPIQLGDGMPNRDATALESHTGERQQAGSGRTERPADPEESGAPSADATPRIPAAQGAREPDDDPWATYVRDFVRRYRLDDAQQRRAWLVYRQARERREFLSQRWAQRIAQCRRALDASPSDDGLRARLSALEKSKADTSRMLFEELKRRLERLPTRAQRRAAEEERVPPPVPAELSGP